MTLQLLKIEEGMAEGAVLFHRFGMSLVRWWWWWC
jgi:hypothetical protein